MNYDDYYNEIINVFNNTIKSSNENLHRKIFNCLVNWYKKGFEETIKKYFDDKNEAAIVNITKQIKSVCNLSDYEKMQEIYDCEELIDLNKLSDNIFNLVKSMQEKMIEFSQEDYNRALSELNRLEDIFPKIIINKFNMIKSECLLDLQYLIKKGNVDNYSLRTYDFLNCKF